MESIFDNFEGFPSYNYSYNYSQWYPNLDFIFNPPTINMISKPITKLATTAIKPKLEIFNPKDTNTNYFLQHGEQLLQEFKSPTNNNRRKIYRATYTIEQQSKIKNKWIQYVNKTKNTIYLLDYVEDIYQCRKNNKNTNQDHITNLSSSTTSHQPIIKENQPNIPQVIQTLTTSTFSNHDPLINLISNDTQKENQVPNNYFQELEVLFPITMIDVNQPSKEQEQEHKVITTPIKPLKVINVITQSNKLSSQELQHEIKQIKHDISQIKHQAKDENNKQINHYNDTKLSTTQIPTTIPIQQWNISVIIRKF